MNRDHDSEYEVLSGRTVEIEPIPNGPMLVRNAEALKSADGTEHAVERPVVAVCVCGFSRRRPWCDGSHKLAKSSGTGCTVLIPTAAGQLPLAHDGS